MHVFFSPIIPVFLGLKKSVYKDAGAPTAWEGNREANNLRSVYEGTAAGRSYHLSETVDEAAPRWEHRIS